MAQDSLIPSHRQSDSPAAESGSTHPGSLEDDENENCELVDGVDSEDSMSDPFEDALEDVASPLVNGGHRVPKYSHHSHHSHQGPCDDVILPARFNPRLSSFRPTSNSKNEDIWDHTEDIATALSWLRQEIRKLKQQDKALLRQFLDLTATIRGYFDQGPRGRVHSYGCTSDENDMTPSPTATMLRPDFFLEFRPRTVSLLSPKDSYHLPVKSKPEKNQ